MRDEFQDYTPDPSAQRSVSDWLMQVIEGKKPDEPGNGTGQKGARPSANGTTVAAVLEEMPREPEKSGPAVEAQPQRAEQKESAAVESPLAQFSAEDLCGPPVIKPAAPAPRSILDDISADDLCWVPEKAQQNGHKPNVVEEGPAGSIKIVDIEEMKPQVFEVEAEKPLIEVEAEPIAAVEESAAMVEPPNPTLASEIQAAKEVKAEAPSPIAESGENSVSAADITRDRVLYAADAERIGLLRPLRKTEPAANGNGQPGHEVTAADIMRDRVLQQMQPAKAVEAEPSAKAPEMVSAQAEAPEIVAAQAEVPEIVAAQAELVEPVPVVETAPAEVMTEVVEVPEAVESESSVFEPKAAADVFVPATAVPIEVQDQEIATAEEHAASAEFPASGVAETGESVFAHKGIWGDAARAEGVEAEDGTGALSDQEPDYRATKGGYLKPEELEELDEASPDKLAAALKGLARLGTVLPQLARTAEGGAANDAGLSHEARHEMGNLRMIQYEIRSTVHDHSLQLKRMEDQMVRVREAMDSDNTENAELADSMKSTVKLVRMIGIGVGILLVVLIAMVGFMLEHH